MCLVYREFDDEPILATARRVIVPAGCVEAARSVLDDAGLTDLLVEPLEAGKTAPAPKGAEA